MEIKIKNIAQSIIGTAVVLMVSMMVLTSCHKKLEPTAIEIEDSIRHYPATILGDNIEMVYVVRNIGNEMLMISDIQPAVPTIEVDKANVDMIPPGEEALLKFVYHSDKNIGLARHIIRLFGNIYPSGVAEIIFDTHVVRPSIDLSDYEEYYHEKLKNDAESILDERKGAKEYLTDTITDGTDKINDINRYTDYPIE
jgi:hypothetical protein